MLLHGSKWQRLQCVDACCSLAWTRLNCRWATVAGLISAGYGLQSSGLAQAGAAWQHHRPPVCCHPAKAWPQPAALTPPLPDLLHCHELWSSTQVLSRQG